MAPSSSHALRGTRGQRAGLVAVGLRLAALWGLLAVSWVGPSPAAAGWTLAGVVHEAETGQAIADAPIRLEGVGRVATHSDSAGFFRFSVDAFPVVVVVDRAGYRPQRITVTSAPTEPLQVVLHPEPYEMTELVVRYEDPAMRIMRQVIRRKQEWLARLRSWTAEAYTRQTLYANTWIVAIREQRSRLYSDRERGKKEIILAGRHSAGVPEVLRYFASSAYFTNLYDDEVEILGQRVLGPTHPAALDHYRVELTATRLAGADTVFEISVQPRGRLETGLAGYLLVRQETYAVVEAGLSLAPPVVTDRVPSRDGLHLRFTQHFAPLASGIWLPVDLEYEIDALLGNSALKERVMRWRGAPTPRARLKGQCRLSGHRVNGRISDFVYQTPDPLEVDGLATADSLTPPAGAALTEAEEQAYARLERQEQAYARRIGSRRQRPLSPVMGLFALYPGLPRPSVVPEAKDEHRTDPFPAETLVNGQVAVATVEQGLGLPVPNLPDGDWVPKPELEVWYNRVEGLHAGGRADLRPNRWVGFHLKGGYALGPRRVHHGAGLSLALGKASTLTISRQSGARPTCASDNYSQAVASFPVLLGIGDYFDYYWNRAWRVDLSHRLVEGGPDLRLGLNLEDHTALAKTTDFDLLCDCQTESGRFYRWFCKDRDHGFRTNPPISPGRLRSLDLRAQWGDPYIPRGQAPNRRVDLLAELVGGPLGGDFDFGRLQLTVDRHWETLLRRRAGSGTLDWRLAAGMSQGDVPRQRLGALDAAIWRYTPFGGFRTRRDRALTGSRYAALFWEHDFGATLFELTGLSNLARTGNRLILHGASGHVWRGCAGCGSDALSHHELGLSWVVEGRWRLDATRRLDRPGWWVGFSKARKGR
ncbi:MAG: DUF5686 family protein [Candidatus Latescibacterota bacterium]|jgi:hypothetical protein